MTTASTGPQHVAPDAVVPGPVLAVLAHPDDETLLAGGLLALATHDGRRVVVVTATRGERGEMIGQPALEDDVLWLEYDTDQHTWTCSGQSDDAKLPAHCRG